ncbi:MAG: ABC transporter permease subunit [Anaerolineaceae bacterium]|nr:ABC transporter permease subunit [Anaerolineaceae bacterium]
MSVLNTKFQQIKGSDWRRGFNQVFKGEMSRWFGSRRWLVQILIYTFLIFPLVLTIINKSDTRILADGQVVAVDHLKEGVEFFNATQGIIGVIGVTLMMEGAILGEKRSGTAAWMLSKPVSRSAFLLGKLISNIIGVFVCIIVAQNIVAYFVITKSLDVALSPINFLAAMLPQTVNLLFYLTLTLMLAVIFNHRGVVIAIPILPLFFDELLIASVSPEVLDGLIKILPFGLATGFGEEVSDAIAKSLMLGSTPASLSPIFWTLFFSLLFVMIALLVFRRQQF